MEVKNPLYKNQGIHVMSTVFTVEKGIIKVLLIKGQDQLINTMQLVGGAVYNNEEPLDAMKRELKVKTGLENIELYFCNYFGEVNRSKTMRMLGLSFIGIIDIQRTNVLDDLLEEGEYIWQSINDLPELLYDHNKIIDASLLKLKTLIFETNILKLLFPKGFTMPEVQKCYEQIFEKTFDRRNLRKQLINSGLIIESNKTSRFEGKKPAILYYYK